MAAVKGNGAASEALLERLEELADKCASRFTPVFTKFLDDREALIAKQFLKRYGDDVRTVFYGGFDGAERCAAGLFPAMLYARRVVILQRQKGNTVFLWNSATNVRRPRSGRLRARAVRCSRHRAKAQA